MTQKKTPMKTLALLLVLGLVFSLSACGNTPDSGQTAANPPESDGESQFLVSEADADTDAAPQQPDSTDPTPASAVPATDEEPEPGSNILIAYFSRIGNTNFDREVDAVASASINLEGGLMSGNAQILAQMVQQAAGGDLFFIETAEQYPAEYRATTDLAKEEQDNNARPALASHVENMAAYDTVVLIYPNWWGTLPQPLFTFLEEYDFSGKTILPLCTHEGSGLGRSSTDIAALCPNALLLEGLAVRGSSVTTAQADVESWLVQQGVTEE